VARDTSLRCSHSHNRGRTWNTSIISTTTSITSIKGRKGRDAVEPSHVYTILALLPVEADGRPRYRIKSNEENFERVVTEELLSRFN
jgi:hypothetical protein